MVNNLIMFVKPIKTYGFQTWEILIFSSVLSYFIGAIPNGFIIGKRLYKVDITEHGSGNIGATNVQRVLGTKPAIFVFLLDFLEGFVPTILSKVIFGSTGFALIIGFFAAFGHDYSFFMKHFKGGKGVATSFGVLTAVFPLLLLIEVLIFFLVIYFSKYVSLGSLIGSATFPFLFSVYMKEPLLFIVSLPFTLLIFVSHRENIKRLINGTERKIGNKVNK